MEPTSSRAASAPDSVPWLWAPAWSAGVPWMIRWSPLGVLLVISALGTSPVGVVVSVVGWVPTALLATSAPSARVGALRVLAAIGAISVILGSMCGLSIGAEQRTLAGGLVSGFGGALGTALTLGLLASPVLAAVGLASRAQPTLYDALDAPAGRLSLGAAWLAWVTALGFVFAYGPAAWIFGALSLGAAALALALAWGDRQRLSWLDRVRKGAEGGWAIAEPGRIADDRFARPLHSGPDAPSATLLRGHSAGAEGPFRAAESQRVVAWVERWGLPLPQSVAWRRRAAVVAVAGVLFGLSLDRLAPNLTISPDPPVALSAAHYHNPAGISRQRRFPVRGLELWRVRDEEMSNLGYVVWDPAQQRELTDREVMARARNLPLPDRIRARLLRTVSWHDVQPENLRRRGERVTFSDGQRLWFTLDLSSGELEQTARPTE